MANLAIQEVLRLAGETVRKHHKKKKDKNIEITKVLKSNA
jgi:hypothetical protein